MGQLKKFFIVLPPGFEQVAFYELVRYLKKLNIEDVHCERFIGGLELELPEAVGLALNSALKIPTRILMRLGVQEILSVKDYISFIKSIDWKPFGKIGKVYVSSRTSKLKIKGNLEDILEKNLPAKAGHKDGTDIYVRFFRDECTLSVDTSGEDLYQRGYEKWVGEAPIRDNMAAALLQYALQGVDDISEWEVLDPMMGSGTFLLESFLYEETYKRKYAFQNWHQPQDVKHNISQSVEKLKGQGRKPQVTGFERDPKTLETAKRNLKQLGIDPERAQASDLLKEKSILKKEKPRLVILNPPLGKRLKIGDRGLFFEILETIAHRFTPDRIAMLVPKTIEFECEGYEQVRLLEFNNNSIPLRFYVFLKLPTHK